MHAGIKSDKWIRERGETMITPFAPYQVKQVEGRRVISYGTSSYGYDMRVGNTWKMFRTDMNPTGSIDPKNPNLQEYMTEIVADEIWIPPHQFVLCHSLESFNIPREINVIVVGKSTYARCGLIVNVTPLEPEWRGQVTIELSNTAPLPIKVYAFEGIAQCLFFESDTVCDISYADKDGKYQHQEGIVLPKV